MNNSCKDKTLPILSRRTFIAGSLALSCATALGFSGCESNTADDRIIRVAAADCVDDYDLLKNTYPIIVSACWHVFESLYEIDKSAGEIAPSIADGEPVQIDELTYDIKIKTNRKFSDGSTLTINDVYASLNSVREDALYSYFYDFVDYGEVIAETNTLRMHLNYSIGNLLMARMSLIRIYKSTVDNDNTFAGVIGTGPWAYESGDASNNSDLVFVPNEFYTGNNKANAEQMI